MEAGDIVRGRSAGVGDRSLTPIIPCLREDGALDRDRVRVRDRDRARVRVRVRARARATARARRRARPSR